MFRIICTVFYPHNRINLLSKYGILNLLESLYAKKEIIGFNYFLSFFKGESTAFEFYGGNNDVETTISSIKTGIYAFMSKYSVECHGEMLPVNRLFLNFKPNTLFFWDYNPYSERHLFKGYKDEELQIKSELCRLCLIELSMLKNMEMKELETLYFRLLMIFRHGVEYTDLEWFGHFLDMLTGKMLELIPESVARVNQIHDQVRNQFLQNKKYYQELFDSDSLSVIPDADITGKGTLSEWLTLLNNVRRIHRKESSRLLTELLVSLFILISQKISLRIDHLFYTIALIKEIIIFRE